MTQKLIVNDPGHGGVDPGAEANGRQEKDYNLQVTTKFTAALQRCGFDVKMTRTTDQLPDGSSVGGNAAISADLNYRAQLANQVGANLFIAWHADSANDPSVGGLAVWIHPSSAGTRTEDWARQIGQSICSATGQPFRGVNQGDFAVLRETSMEAVLIEGDFITNAAAAQKLFDPTFQTQQAEGAARAVCGIFGAQYVDPIAHPATGNTLPFSATAGQKNIAWLGDFYQHCTDPDAQKAAHWAADHTRVAIGVLAPENACKDTSFSADGALAVIKAEQAEWLGIDDAALRAAAHWVNDELRALKGITA